MPAPSVLNPTPRDFWVGPQAGLAMTTHSGGFLTPLCRCEFADGTGKGFIAGVELGYTLSRVVAVAVKVLYQDLRGDYSNTVTLPTLVVGEPERVPVAFQRDLKLGLSYLSINPMLQLHPLWGFYVQAGPAFGIRTKSSYSYTMRPIDPAYTYLADGSSVAEILEDSGELDGAKSTRLDVRVGAGYNLPLSKYVFLAPEVTYNLPVSTIAADDDWKVSAIQVAAVLKIFF